MAATPIIPPLHADEAPVEIYKSGKYLTFRVARQDFAMSADLVRGILPVHEMATLEVSHPWLCGFAAIGGHDFPVVDLRAKLGIAHGSRGREPLIVVVETGVEAHRHLAGFIADRISEVIELRQMDFRSGAVRGHGRPRRLLDPDQIMTAADWAGFWVKPSL
jgi:chemotaxis signal transduction protein